MTKTELQVAQEVVQILLLFVLFREWNFSIAVRSRLLEVRILPIMTPILAKVTAIEKRGDQYQVIVQISPKYRGSFNTLAFGEIKPHSGSLKDGRLDLVYYQNPGLNPTFSTRRQNALFFGQDRPPRRLNKGTGSAK